MAKLIPYEHASVWPLSQVETDLLDADEFLSLSRRVRLAKSGSEMERKHHDHTVAVFRNRVNSRIKIREQQAVLAAEEAEMRHAFTIKRGRGFNEALFCEKCGAWQHSAATLACRRYSPEQVARNIEERIGMFMESDDRFHPGARVRIEMAEAGHSMAIMIPVTALRRRYQDVVNIYNRREPMP